jgi:uncharacterized protein (DUF427 family)
MANPAPGFVTRPDHRVDITQEGKRVRVSLAGVTIADSSEALRVEETGHDPVYYFPQKDVRLDLMRATQHHTRCPFKGEASYWTVEVPGRTAENAVWGYLSPYDEAMPLAGRCAFYQSRVDAITVG